MKIEATVNAIANTAVNAAANTATATTASDGVGITDTTTFSELVRILRENAEIENAEKLEALLKAKEQKEAALRDAFGEDYDLVVEESEEAGKDGDVLLQKAKRRPGVAQLRASQERIARYSMSDGAYIEVYKNGYAIYDNGNRKTVIWVPDCGQTTYYFAPLKDSEKEYQDQTAHVGEDDMAGLPWYIPLTIAGENGIERNLDHPKSHWTMSDLDDLDEWNMQERVRWVSGARFENPEDTVVRDESARELREALPAKQKEAFELYYDEGYTQKEIAEKLNIRKQSVKNRLDNAKKTIGAWMEKREENGEF